MCSLPPLPMPLCWSCLLVVRLIREGTGRTLPVLLSNACGPQGVWPLRGHILLLEVLRLDMKTY